MKGPTAQSDCSPVEAAELAVADMVGKLMHFWGFKRPMGRVWTVLYLSPQPLAAADLCAALTMSAGGVSMALSALEKWGCIHRCWLPGERREYFAAEENIWKMVQRVLRQRELLLVAEFGDSLELARAAVEQAQARAPDAEASDPAPTPTAMGQPGVADFVRSSEAAATPASGAQIDSDARRQGDARDDLSYKRQRLSRLIELTHAGQTLLSALAAGHAVDPTLLIHAPSAPAPPSGHSVS